MSTLAFPLFLIIGIIIFRALNIGTTGNRSNDTASNSDNLFDQNVHQQHQQQSIFDATNSTSDSNLLTPGIPDFNLPHETQHHSHSHTYDDTPVYHSPSPDSYSNTDSSFTDSYSSGFDSSYSDSSSGSSSMDSTSSSND